MAEKMTQEPAPAGATKKPTKTEAVGLAMQSLGEAATRDQIRVFVKDQFGYEMTPDHISNCKGELAKKAKKAKAATAAKKPAAPKPAPQATPAPVQQKAVATLGGNSKPQAVAAATGNGRARTVALDDVLAVKGLVDRVGGDGLRELIAAFER